MGYQVTTDPYALSNQSTGRKEEMTHLYLPLLVILLALSIPAYSASIVLSNLGPGNPYQLAGFPVSGAKAGQLEVLAQGFTPDGNFTLTQIDVALLAWIPPAKRHLARCRMDRLRTGR
jgi:hypothetical protein